MSDSYRSVPVDDLAQWRSWLDTNHASSPGIWLVTWKKGSGHPYVAWDGIVDEALCYGWIDSRPRTVDDLRSSRLLTPRRPGSSWSARNKARVQELIAAGRMHASGLAAVEAARADGTWEALDIVETLEEPADLAAGLDAVPEARRQWGGFPRSTRRAILEWIGAARTPATRQARIDRTVADAAVGIRANQWRQPKGATDVRPAAGR